jgi:hypothetical protein
MTRFGGKFEDASGSGVIAAVDLALESEPAAAGYVPEPIL